MASNPTANTPVSAVEGESGRVSGHLPTIAALSGASSAPGAVSEGIYQKSAAPEPQHAGIGISNLIASEADGADEESRKRQRIGEPHNQQVAVQTAPNGGGGVQRRAKNVGGAFDKAPLVEMLREFFPQRHHLGTIVYNPTTTWSTLQTERLVGIKPEHAEKFVDIKERYVEKLQDKDFIAAKKYIPVIPPLPVEYSNSYLEIKIPNRFISTVAQVEEARGADRNIWGGNGGIYTDDSDVLNVLKHLGLFNGSIDLSTWNDKWESSDVIAPASSTASGVHSEHLDVSVTVLLLPPLQEYEGQYANGINPRPWPKTRRKHNGLSYAVYNVKWESSGTYLREKGIYKDAIKERLEDLEVVKHEMQGKAGWKFNEAYFSELREKYKKLGEEERERKKQEEEEKKKVQQQEQEEQQEAEKQEEEKDAVAASEAPVSEQPKDNADASGAESSGDGEQAPAEAKHTEEPAADADTEKAGQPAADAAT